MLRSTLAAGRAGRAFVVAAAALITVALTPDAWARMGGAGGHFGGGGFSGRSFSGGSFSGGRAGFAPRGGFAHAHGHGHFRGAVVIGGGLGFWYPSVYPYPYPYPYAYPYPAYAYPYPYDAGAVPAYGMPPPAQVWYYCDAAGAYYPNVATCPGGWREVPATPAQAAPAPVQ